jgi:hypothetical protein
MAFGSEIASIHGRMVQRVATAPRAAMISAQGALTMAVTIQKVDVWSAEIRDEIGGLDAVLRPLADAGADLAFIVA